MNGKKIYTIGLFLTSIGIMSSCLKPKEFPIEPSIEYKDFTVINDSAKLTITFTDGDGDIGLEEDEIYPPYDTSSRYHFNFFVEYWEKDINGIWSKGQNLKGEDLIFSYRLPVITPEGKHKALKGEIEVGLAPYYYNLTSPMDTIEFMYKVQLVDRELNESNWLESPHYIKIK